MLELSQIEAGYDGASILRGVSLAVGQGEVVALLGSNGAGKTTLLNTVAGIVETRKGTIRLRGKEIQHLAPYRRAADGIVLVPEGRRIFSGMTVLENLRVGQLCARSTAEAATRLNSVFQLFPSLESRSAQPASTLSGGEQQMLALGRALMAQPDVLLVDEPSLGLAPGVAKRLFEAIAALAKRGLGILMAEQNVKLVLGVAQRACVMRYGQLVFEGAASELSARSDLPELYWGTEKGSTPRA